MSDQRQLFDPDGVPYTPYAPTDTSLDAAARIVPVAKTIRQQVLDAIRRTPSTDEELQVRLGYPGNTIRPRRRELQQRNLIRDSEDRRPTASGRSAIVWEVV